jgi:hexose kinase, 1-phosphofructokinase family
MILVVSLNLSIDRTISVDDFVSGEVHRATHTELQVGGKGVNVARTLKALDEPYELIGLIGGQTGEDIDSRLEQEGIKRSLVRVSGESRSNYVILSNAGQTVINENGPLVEEQSIEEITRIFSERIADCDVAVLTGSVQPGINPELYTRLIQIAKTAGTMTVLDAVGQCLIDGLAGGPTIAKPNQYEAQTIYKKPINSESDALNAARLMMKMGAQNAAITMGKLGLVVSTPQDGFIFRPPCVDVVNAVGSGDATAAGFATGLRRGLSLVESARLAVACGTASVRHGFGRCSPAEIEEIKQQLEIKLL